MTTKKILLIDDNEAWRKLVPEILMAVGAKDVEIVEAGTAEDGIRVYKNMNEQHDKPDLVLLDVRLPCLSGQDAADAIMKEDKDTQIYAFTGYDDVDTHIQLKRTGVKGIISKMSTVVIIGNQIKEALKHGA